MTVSLSTLRTNSFTALYNFLHTGTYKITNYDNIHNSYSDTYMKQQGYPQHAIHQAQHAKFIENLNDFKKEYQKEQGKHLYLALKIQHKLVDWLIHHIGESDQQFGLFLKEKAL